MANKTYQSVSELISDLIDTGNNYVNWKNFNASFFQGIEDKKPTFWRELLTYLQENGPTLEADFNEQQTPVPSVFWYINEKADLVRQDDVWNKITDEMINGAGIDLHNPSGVADNPEHPDRYFWNESLSKLIAIYVSSFDTNSGQVVLKDGVAIPLNNLKNADAGYSFVKDWVNPTFNIDEKSYEEVRGADAIKSVLQNSNQLQYTREQTTGDDEGWIRLLMPKYLRKVEVEDLNRNFWVIAQTLSAVCAYLFGSKSVKDLFEGILKELIGLWENCLYLWAAAAMISQEDKASDIHIEFAPLTNSKIYGYRKFDNFGETYPTADTPAEVITIIKDRMDYLIQLYSHSHIIIIPEVRGDNYKHNYYSKVEYPGMMVYNRNTSHLTWVNFKVDQTYQMGAEHLVVNLAEDFNTQGTQLYVNKIGAIIDKNEVYYDFKQRFSSISSSETSPYYAAIRTRIPSFNVVYDNQYDLFRISNFKINLYDAAAQAIDGNQYLICSFAQGSPLTVGNQYESLDLNLTYDDSEATLNTLSDATNIPIEHGYYLGELVSCQSIIGLNSYSIDSHSYHGQQLYSADPEQIISIMEGS